MNSARSALLTPESRGYRKASLRILPLIACGYGIAYIDRVNISFAALQMNKDLSFSATAYGLGAGLFFLGYSIFEVPSNLLLCRFGARRWLARIMVSWGLLAMAMALVRTPTQFYVARFALGVAEAGFFPGVIYYVSSWFPPPLRARAVTRFYVAWPLSVVIMGLVAGALMGLDGTFGLRGWQWLFLVEGFPAIVMGVIFILVLPDQPQTARWLTADERQALQPAFSGTLPHDLQAKARPARAVFRDPRVWLLGAFNFCMLGSSYAYSFSAPLMVRDITGLSVAGIGLVVAAMNLCGAIAMFSNGILSDRGRDTYFYVVPGCVLMVLGFIVSATSTEGPLALAGLWVTVIGHMSMQGGFWSIATRSLQGRAAAAGIAVINSVGILGGFAGPYWMGVAKDWTGDYRRGLLVMAFPMLIATGIMVYLRRRDQRPASTIPAVAS